MGCCGHAGLFRHRIDSPTLRNWHMAYAHCLCATSMRMSRRIRTRRLWEWATSSLMTFSYRTSLPIPQSSFYICCNVRGKCKNCRRAACWEGRAQITVRHAQTPSRQHPQCVSLPQHTNHDSWVKVARIDRPSARKPPRGICAAQTACHLFSSTLHVGTHQAHSQTKKHDT